MWDSFTEVIPAPVVIGVGLVVGTAYLMAPEVGRRIADRTAMAQCQANAEALTSGNPDTQINRQLGMAVLEAIAGQFPGALIGEAGAHLKGQMQSAADQSISNVAETCRCLIEQVVHDPATRTELTIWLLSLRIVEQRRVANLGREMAMKARLGHCRAGVMP
jgi:hypothetical protein